MLQLDGVVAGYGGTTVLNGMTLRVDDGETVALVGRNGAGKTTTLRTIMGTLRASAGSIAFDGRELTRMPAHGRVHAGVAYVPQGRLVFPRLTVEENLRVAAEATGRGWRSRVSAVLEDFPALIPKRGARGGSLSGGQQQMLALARALIAEPRLLLLDEPCEGIQPSIVDAIAESLQELRQRRGFAVLLVEQNLDFATRLASRAYIVDKGVAVRDLPAEAVLGDEALQREFMAI